MLELKIHLESLIDQMELMALIILKPHKEIMELDRKMLEKHAKEINEEINNPNDIEEEPLTIRAKYWKMIERVTPLRQDNYHEFDHAIHIFRKDEWLTDFPKGSNLISYLYNVLLA